MPSTLNGLACDRVWYETELLNEKRVLPSDIRCERLFLFRPCYCFLVVNFLLRLRAKKDAGGIACPDVRCESHRKNRQE